MLKPIKYLFENNEDVVDCKNLFINQTHSIVEPFIEVNNG